ncbi:peptide/nickel transport system substrate-binding protein [Nesterenkonia aurantiaca]|uniref:Peptide/nickel transport system substrate-binding protein n=2 Tax=Nesterenkonia aurantiaca TaxID=1436010 RepID=A0A4R7G4X8_9MICC|nr:peptide/nickel transport system substrate-binding protein [Nesterenkonia aurantiaca]
MPRLMTTIPLAGVFALTGCFSSSGEEQSTSESADTDARISVAMLQPPRSGLSPLSDDAFKLSRWSTAETLIALDAEGEAQPGLATEWSQDDADPSLWRFTIRDGVTFHDGSELTAAAVMESLQAAIDASPQPRILDGVDLELSVEDDDVLVRTADEDPLVPQRLSSPQLSILAEEAYEGAQVVDPIGHGTGPFELISVDGTSSATLDRYEDYWGDPARASGMDVEFVPDGTARAAALRTGDADVVEAVPVGQAGQIDEDLIYEVAMPRTNTLYLNTEEGPFSDPEVRAAAREAIDRAALIEGAYESRADVAEGLLGPALPWAADLRDEASYQEIIGQRAEPAAVDGVEISLGTFTDRSELPEVAVLLEQQLEQAGFVVTQDVREYQYIEADAVDGVFDAFILSRATVLDSGDPVAYMYSDFACEGSFNISQFCADSVDTALQFASEQYPADGRELAIMEAEAQILAEDAAIPLLHERVIQGEAASVSGAEQDPRERLLITGETALGESD